MAQFIAQLFSLFGLIAGIAIGLWISPMLPFGDTVFTFSLFCLTPVLGIVGAGLGFALGVTVADKTVGLPPASPEEQKRLEDFFDRFENQKSSGKK